MSAVMKKYRVAFSYAGEKREVIVQETAERIAERFGKGRVLYDKFHQAEFARPDLGKYLPALYEKKSELIVVVICEDYQGKTWCKLEWKTIRDVIRTRHEGEKDAVMLCRYGGLTAEGLEGLAGFVDLDEKKAQEFAQLIFERVVENERKRWRFVAWFLAGVVPLLLPPLSAFYPASMRMLTILLSALLMGIVAFTVNVVKVRPRYAVPVFAAACIALVLAYAQTVVRVNVTQPNGSARSFAYVTGSNTVPVDKSPDCACEAGTSAQRCAQGAPSDDAMEACFGANRILFSKVLLMLLYLVATAAFTASVRVF